MRLFWLCLITLILAFPAHAQIDPGNKVAIESLRAGGHVIVFRHGATYQDQADTDPLNIGNVAKQRQLNDQGRALAREIGSRGITVNCVAPGFIDTDMTKALPEEQQTALKTQIPLGRLGSPEDIGHAVAFLASPQAGYITGTTLHVNGGMYMQ